MSFDPFSPFAPARVRVLVLPMGRIKRSRFTHFHRLLTEVGDVRFQDLSSEGRPSATVFSPESFPPGMVLFDFNASAPPASHVGLVPFELFREPMIVLGIADAQEYLGNSPDARKEEFSSSLNGLRDRYTRTLMHRVLLFDEPSIDHVVAATSGLVQIPKLPILAKIAQDLALTFLDEVASYAKSILPLPSIPSPTVPQDQMIQAAWSTEDIPGISRQSTYNGATSRSSTPGVDNKELHRMSMPSLPSSDSASRNQSPGGRSPARTFEEMTQNTPTTRSDTAAYKPSKLRPGSMALSRENSQDRVSVHGFGSDSFNEKARSKGRGRVGVVLASVFLQAGRWHDALREAVESGHKARAMHDPIWHAKALEIITLCMILLAWSGYEFAIPQICYPSIEKSTSTSDAEAPAALEITTFSSPAAQMTLLKMLTNLIPVLTQTIMGTYARTSLAGSGDVMPQTVFSEFGIRMARLMASIHLAGGTLTNQCVSHVVLGTPLSSSVPPDGTKPRVFPSRREISNLLTRSQPPPHDQTGLSSSDRIAILSGTISVYSSLGMQRKKALVLKDLIETLTPILHQIKVQGAAEAGFHPSSGQANFTRITGNIPEDEERGLEGLLNAVCHVYSVPESTWLRSIGIEALNGGQDPKKEQSSLLPEGLIGNFVLRSYGSPDIKIEVLRACIRLCEALPDYHGILHYSSALLRAAGPGIAQSSDAGDALVILTSEEQLQLSGSIIKTVADAKAAGLDDVDADYWDDFLVRGLYILDAPRQEIFLPHKKSDLQTPKAAKAGPFIHNPFASTKKHDAWHNLLAVGDDREFVVSLQNPYDFEVVIQRIKLSSDDDQLDISSQDLVLRPYRTQSFSLVGNMARDGPVLINGCIIKIKGCKERLFPIFSQPWTPATGIKVKTAGFVKPKSASTRLSDGSNISSLRENLDATYPIPKPLHLTVIPKQPVLTITKTSISHNALMLLEGEKTTFSITLQNTSAVPTDFLHISFFDSATGAMHDALSQKGLAPGDMYEIEYQLLRLPAISMFPDQPAEILPGMSETFSFNLLAKPGLTSVSIQFDYGNISQPHIKGKDTIFTRQLVVPLSVTVNASIQIQRLEILPLSSDFVWPPRPDSKRNANPDRPKSRFDSVFGPLEVISSQENYCILLFDIRNSWPSPLNFQIQANHSQAEIAQLSETSDLINPGQTVRQMLVIPRIYISNPHSQITPISPARQRQFVVSSDKISPEHERSLREMFWFRERLLGFLKGSWMLRSKMRERVGNIDLRTIRFNTRMVDVLRLPDITVSYSLLGDSVREKTKQKYEIPVDDFATLRTTIFNRSTKMIRPLVRLRPSLVDQSREIALDMGKRFAWSGVLQQTLPPLKPESTNTVDLPVCALCAGEFEVKATIEEVCPAIDEANLVLENKNREPILDALVADTGRRTWTAEESCIIVAVNVEEPEK